MPQKLNTAITVIGIDIGISGAVLAGLIIVTTAVRAGQILSSLHWRLRGRNSALSMITIMHAGLL